MSDYNSWLSLIFGIIFGVVVVTVALTVVVHEWRLNRYLTRVQVTTPAEREQAALVFEQQRMVRATAHRTTEPTRQVTPLVIDLDALEAG